MKHYDLVVLGEEIAGIWYLKELAKKYQDPALLKKKNGLPQSILWVRTRNELPVFRLPVSIATQFEIPIGERWNMELAFPEKVILWNQKKIDSYLAGHPLKTGSWLTQDKTTTRICQHLLTQISELGVIAKGIWSSQGYSDNLSNESKVWASFLCGEMASWDTTKENPFPKVEVLTLESQNQILKLKSSHKQVELEVLNGEKYSTSKLLLNSELSRLKTLIGEESFQSIGFSDEVFSDFALYGLQIEFEKEAYLPFQKSCLLFSSEGVPDTNREISLLEGHGNLRLQVCERRNASLYHILERFKLALKDLSRGYPELPLKVKSYYPPLGLESCYSDSSRRDAINLLNSEKRDLYRLTQVTSGTAVTSIKNISPQVNCHMPYPYGTLMESKKLLSEYG